MKGSQQDGVRTTLTVMLDILVTTCVYLGAGWFRRAIEPWAEPLLGTWAPDRVEYNMFLAVVLLCMWPALWLTGCYARGRRMSLRESTARVFVGLLLAQVAMIVVYFYAKGDFLSRGVLVLFTVGCLAGMLAVRWLVGAVTKARRRPRTLVVGTGVDAARLAAVLRDEEGHEVVGFLGTDAMQTPVEGVDPVLGVVRDADTLIAQHTPIDQVALAVRDAELNAPAVDAAEQRGIAVRQLLLPLAASLHKVHFEHIGGLDMLTMKQSAADDMALLVKRAIDIAGALAGLSIAAVLFPVVAIAIKRSSPGPVLYRQRRVGLNGREFYLYKFRTMVVGAHEMRGELSHLNEMNGPRFKIEKDPRVTPIGRWLRRFSLDEFPQFYSVLVGDMSLIGPRPFPVEEVRQYEGAQHRRLGMKPGLTGLWQVGGRCDLKDFAQMLELDESYIQNWSLWLDLHILSRTIPAVLFGRGAM